MKKTTILLFFLLTFSFLTIAQTEQEVKKNEFSIDGQLRTRFELRDGSFAHFLKMKRQLTRF